MRSVDRPLHLTVELDIDESSVRGLARDSEGRELPFVGWLGLVSAVDRLRAPATGPLDLPSDPEEKP
jgi:hypothetical protein